MGLIDKDHVYSYSQLTSFEECPYSFYLQKIDEDVNKEDLVDNCFGLQGSFIHDLIDKWAKGKISASKLPKEYEKNYEKKVGNNWPAYLPSDYGNKTYLDGLRYFENFDEFKGYEIVSTEQMFKMPICDRMFLGFIDMVLRDKITGELIVLDHKRKSLATFKKEEKTIWRQQYLYSNYIKKEYGEFPQLLQFNLFLENGTIKEKEFDMNEYNATMEWVKKTIDKIENFELTDWFVTRMDILREKAEKKGKDPDSVRLDAFCSSICSCRNICEECH